MIRIGNGYDVHKLVEGRKLTLGGVEIPYENIGEFFKALNESVALCDSIPRSKIHDELNSDIGGGA